MNFNQYGIKSKNIFLMYLIDIIGGLLFFLPVLALYYEETLFTLTNVALVFAIEAIARVIFEIPTGAVADLFGRKKTLILAHLFAIIAVIFLFIGGNMFMFSCYAVLNALAIALNSGTADALVYDTLHNEKKEKDYKKINGSLAALWPLGASVGSIIGGYLAYYSLSLPVLATIIPLSCAFILTFFLKEPKYKKENHKMIKHISNSFQIIIKNKQLLILMLGGFILLGLGEATHLLNPLFFKFKEIPIIYYGYISAFVFIFSSLGHYLSHSVSERIGNKRTILLSILVSPLLLIFATFAKQYFAVLLFIIPSFFFGLRNPVISHLQNLEVNAGQRATVISTCNFVSQLGIALFTPFVGYLAGLYNVNIAFRLTGLLFIFIIPLIYLQLKEKN